MNIIILEDNHNMQMFCKNLIDEFNKTYFSDFTVKLISDDPFLIKNFILQKSCSAIFLLDILIDNEIEGIALAKLIYDKNPQNKIIFMTMYPEYIKYNTKLKLIAYNIIYKSKKYFKIELFQTLYSLMMDFSKNSFYCYNHMLGHNRILYQDIYFFERLKNSKKICLEHSNGMITFMGSLVKVLKTLDDRFLRCHASYIVNKHKIKRIDVRTKQLILENKRVCYYSYLHKKELEQWIKSQQ